MKIFKEVKIVKEVKRSEEKCREVMTCDVSPVAMFIFDRIYSKDDLQQVTYSPCKAFVPVCSQCVLLP